MIRGVYDTEDLVDRLAARDPALTVKDAERLVCAIFEVMAQQLVDGGSVELRKFGSALALVGRGEPAEG